MASEHTRLVALALLLASGCGQDDDGSEVHSQPPPAATCSIGMGQPFNCQDPSMQACCGTAVCCPPSAPNLCPVTNTCHSLESEAVDTCGGAACTLCGACWTQ
jgi:hypothetical protein